MTRQPGHVIWLMGLSGSGKTTLTELLQPALEASHPWVSPLDGDQLREALGDALGFSEQQRRISVSTMIFLAGRLAREGAMVLVANMSPYQDLRDKARAELPGYIEIFLDPGLETVQARDVKGLYSRAARGETDNVAGLDSRYDGPGRPDLLLDQRDEQAVQTAERILAYLRQRGLVE